MTVLKETMSADEIIDAMTNCTTVPDRFKAEVLTILNATLQAAYNSMSSPEVMYLVNTYGDQWQEQHNRIVELYQRCLEK